MIKTILLVMFTGLFAISASHVRASAGPKALPADMNLADGWRVVQDVRDLGEKIGWYEPDFLTPEVQEFFNKSGAKPDLAVDWQPIDRLAHLQLLLASQPYFGRSLRYFNESPWWYRLNFTTPTAQGGATLRFEGVDYFAKVWLNGTLLGEHEGYANPFEFEVGSLLRKDAPNVLVVKVSSPWDHEYANAAIPVLSVVRNLMKGSYEHADTFVQRDVNPVGIWRPVKLLFHGALHEVGSLTVTTELTKGQQQATAKMVASIVNDGPAVDIKAAVHIQPPDSNKDDVAPKDGAMASRSYHLEHGLNTLQLSAVINSPQLWTTWDRGAQPLYRATLDVTGRGKSMEAEKQLHLRASTFFGVRTVELHRSSSETRFFINGKPVYLRGTSYWPDLYLSNMSRDRYERDIDNAVRAGINAIRVHVHTENPEFYELCDRRGIVVIQDNDLNWLFPTDAQFAARAVQHFGTIVTQLQNHPSIIAWVAMNEVFWGLPTVSDWTKDYTLSDAKRLGAQLVAEAQRIDPSRPVIENSMISNDLASGDTHDYRGSLNGGTTTYFDIFSTPQDGFGSPAKLVTEFGVDAPPAPASLRAAPEIASRLADVLPQVTTLHDYQYRLLKYYIEQYRIHKYAPNAGYFQFMWIDFSPQSFYGVYDYWGNPKSEGLGGGIRAMRESNQPIAIMMEHDARPRALYVVNDTSKDLGDCVARWRVTRGTAVIAESSQHVRIGADSIQKVRDLAFPVTDDENYHVALELIAADGRVLTRNEYENPFHLQPRPQGYPQRIDDEMGIRLWWAGENK